MGPKGHHKRNSSLCRPHAPRGLNKSLTHCCCLIAANEGIFTCNMMCETVLLQSLECCVGVFQFPHHFHTAPPCQRGRRKCCQSVPLYLPRNLSVSWSMKHRRQLITLVTGWHKPRIQWGGELCAHALNVWLMPLQLHTVVQAPWTSFAMQYCTYPTRNSKSNWEQT
jgi:hypothetical protein